MAAARMLIIGVLGFWAVLLVGCSSEAEPGATAAGNSVLDVTLKGVVFRLELALDEDNRIQGLSDREEIAADGGMLFVFPEAQRRQFVMRRCLVPIDIAYLDAEGKVVWMHAMQVEADPDTPENRLKRYDSHYPAQFAIELREGTIRRLGLAQEDRIDLPIEALKDRAR